MFPAAQVLGESIVETTILKPPTGASRPRPGASAGTGPPETGGASERPSDPLLNSCVDFPFFHLENLLGPQFREMRGFARCPEANGLAVWPTAWRRVLSRHTSCCPGPQGVGGHMSAPGGEVESDTHTQRQGCTHTALLRHTYTPYTCTHSHTRRRDCTPDKHTHPCACHKGEYSLQQPPTTMGT